MSTAFPVGKRGRRLWLLVVIVVLAAVGAWHSWSRRVALPPTELDLANGRPKLLEFGMGICEQCKRMRPVMERAQRELAATVDVHILDMRNEVNERLAEHYELRVIPLVLLLDGSGRELWRHEGFIGFGDVRRVVFHKATGL